jgi:hypothetical protein
MDKEDHQRHSEGHREKDVRLDRHSASGADPNPKKGGHGGWGTGVEGYDESNLDPNDPNYDAEEAKKQSS